MSQKEKLKSALLPVEKTSVGSGEAEPPRRIDAILAFVDTIEPKQLGRPVQSK